MSNSIHVPLAAYFRIIPPKGYIPVIPPRTLEDVIANAAPCSVLFLVDDDRVGPDSYVVLIDVAAVLIHSDTLRSLLGQTGEILRGLCQDIKVHDPSRYPAWKNERIDSPT